MISNTLDFELLIVLLEEKLKKNNAGVKPFDKIKNCLRKR